MITHHNFGQMDPYSPYMSLQNQQQYYNTMNTGNQQMNQQMNQQLNRMAAQQQNLPDGPGIPCRMFVQENNIKANEVPSDGTISAFVSSDFSCIYLKAVNNQNTIDTLKFVPEKVEKPAQEETSAPVVDLSPVMAELETIKKALYKRNNYHKPYKKPAERKEGEA